MASRVEGVVMSMESEGTVETRPLGISVLAVLAGVGTVLGIGVLLVAMGGGAVVQGGAAAFVVVPGIIVLGGAVAYGLWNLRWWAWPLAMLSWFSSGVQAVVGLTDGRLNTDLVVAPIAVTYLLQAGVRAAFGHRILSPDRRFVVVTAALALVLGAAPIGVAAVAAWSPTVPDDAGSTLVAQVDLARLDQPLPAPDPDESGSMAGECLERDQRLAGWLDLCWSVIRQADEDTEGDYYRFEAYGTFASEATDAGQASGSGVRWLVVRNRLLVPTIDNVWSAWPDGPVDGCASTDLVLPPSIAMSMPEIPCDGRTVGQADAQTHTVTWTCLGCLLPDPHARAIGLSEDVKVGEGVAPAWELYVDFGD